MARPVVLGNGSLTVGLNEQGLVHDFYYPYVGLDNLTTARSVHHKIGIWVDGTFSWIDDGSWQISVTFEEDALVSNCVITSEKLQVKLVLHDFVDNEINAFCRQIEVVNLDQHDREIRLFMHQVFQISRAGRADTALYIPDEHYILDYKGRCSLLIYGQNTDGTPYDQYAVGSYGIEGKEGTYRDAEDGELSGSAVEHGGVDSVIRFRANIDGGSSAMIDYWIIAADSQVTAEKHHLALKKEGLAERLKTNRQYWQNWLAPASNIIHSIDAQYATALKKSLLVIKAHTDKRGGIIASADSSIYNYGRDYYSYVWPRDGAFAIWPLIRLGYTEEPKRFFEFCRDVITPDGYMMHKYQPDRAIGSTWHPWVHGKRTELPIQEDETASIIYMLGEYHQFSKDDDFVRSLYDTLIKPASDFMAGFIDESTGLPHASYDLWEEKFITSTYTTVLTYQALLVAADFADSFGNPDDAVNWRKASERIGSNTGAFVNPETSVLRKGFLLNDDNSITFDDTLDLSSFYGVMLFGERADAPYLKSTAEAIENKLTHSPSGGIPRYENDVYFQSNPAHQGNPWFISTLWMAQYYIRLGKYDQAKDIIAWVLNNTAESGILSEQINPNDGSFLSVAPLVWSHAELINTILDTIKK